MSNNIERNATWRVGVYCRLSKDDELTGESASISNQRDILVNYCQSQGWQVVDVFQDDGYTGLNTDRPDLQRLLKACEKGLVNLVITKDQSRLGRNHVQTGFLMEEFFPKHGVRYIALYDNVDTFAGDNEIAPFKNVLNEMYSRDISKKVHASYHLQATKGKFTGVVPPLRQHRLSGKFSSGRWTVMGLTLYPENWNASRFPARHGGTGNGDSAPITQNGKRKTRKMGNMYGMNPI